MKIILLWLIFLSTALPQKWWMIDEEEVISSLNTESFANGSNSNFDYDVFTGATAKGFTASVVSVSGAYVEFRPKTNFEANTNYTMVYDLIVNAGVPPDIKERVSVSLLVSLVAGTNQTTSITTTGAFSVLYVAHNAGETADFILSNVVIYK